MSRGIDRTELVREQLAKGGVPSASREEGKREELVKGSPKWLKARDEARKAMKEKAEKLRAKTEALNKDTQEKFGNNGDDASSGERFNFPDE